MKKVTITTVLLGIVLLFSNCSDCSDDLDPTMCQIDADHWRRSINNTQRDIDSGFISEEQGNTQIAEYEKHLKSVLDKCDL